MRDRIRFLLGGQKLEIDDCAPTTTVLDWLRGPARRKGSKEGCAEGDCGACTVVLAELDGAKQLHFRAVNACILFLPMLDGKALFTVEDLATADGELHPVQQAMVEQHGSQCGFCTPGFVMSLFAGFHAAPALAPRRAELDAMLAGNLCRCTGYAPILRAAQQALVAGRSDALSAGHENLRRQLLDLQPTTALSLQGEGGRFDAPLDAGQLAGLLAEHPDATLVAGATDVGLWVTKQLRELPHLVHTARVAELQELRVDAQDGRLRIGAAVTYSQAFDAVTARWPAFATVLGRLGGLQVRNSGTIGGNIANGSPIGDMPPGLIALGARLVLRSREGQREIACEDFFIDYGQQDLRPGEFLQTILLPAPEEGLLFRTWKISKRFEQDISAVCGAFALRIADDVVVSARVAFGGMAATPRRASRCEAALQGQPWNEATLAAAMQALDQDYQPISDWRASADYRRRIARNLLRRLYLESLGEPVGAAPRGDPGLSIAAGAPLPQEGADPSASVVHAALPHDSAAKHVSGTALYVDDLPEPDGLLHACAGLSQVAHGHLLSLDLDAVRAAPGVVAVLTAADIPGPNDVSPVGANDDPLLAEGKVWFHGQPLFLVVAESRDAARRAARLGRAEIQPLPPVLEIDAAAQAQSWVVPPHAMQRGEPQAALAAAPHRLQGVLNSGGQDHFYLEGQISMALPGEDGDFRILTSSQHPTEVQHAVASALGLKANAVTVDVRRMGGAFGGKETQAAQWAVLAALAARVTGRPVKLRLDRDDDMLATGKRHEFRILWDAGFDAEGRLQTVTFDLASRCGFSADLSGAIADRAMFHADNAYYLPQLRIDSWRCRTNTVSNTAFRGFGGPQGMLGIERVMDAIAAHLGLDPLDVRLANLYGDEGRDTTPYGMRVTDNVLDRMIPELRRASDYDARRAAIADFNARSAVLKRGIALTPVKFGISFTTSHLNQAGALLHVYTDGSVMLNHGGTEMGQGLMVKVAQVVADELGVPLERVKVTATSTGKVPNTSATAASSGSDMNGMAARAAARKLRLRMARWAAQSYGGMPSQVRFAGGEVQVAGRSFTFAQVARGAWAARVSLSATGFYRTPKIHYDRATASGRPFLYFAYGAAVSEVELDTLTGEYRLHRVDILHEVGRSLNPAIDLGQVEGGFIQGLGWLTTEELWWDADGALRTHAPSTYKIPTVGDLPAQFHVQLWDQGRNAEPTIHRSKAVGEPPLMLAISAHSALAQAVMAHTGRFPELDAPATPERLLACLRGGPGGA